MFKKKSFSNYKIWEVDNYTSYAKAGKSVFSTKNMFKYLFLIICLFCVVFLGKYVLTFSKVALWQLSRSTVGMIANNLGEEMKKDQFGNINILLVWLGWWWHAWWYLADSIIVASYNPKLGAVTMISVPRDFYVFDHQRNSYGKINSMFARGVSKWHELSSWAMFLSEKVEQILGIETPYYAVIDFDWFEKVIDSLWWITINVPYRIHDVTYPDKKLWYMTFHVDSWVQMMDGRTALMYARSRHTTSDFARSERQQDIIKAILNQAFKAKNITSISKVKELYGEYQEMVTTNISLQQMIGMTKYLYDFKHIFTFWLTTECSYRDIDLIWPWCFLYAPDREQFGWASVMIPMWASIGNLEFYDYLKNFAFFVAYNQEYLIENPKIIVQNGIDKTELKRLWKSTEGWATRVGVKLKKYGFNIVWAENAQAIHQETTVYISWTGSYDWTIKNLQPFIPTVRADRIFNSQILTWWDMVIVIGNDYIQSLEGKSFNYEK